MATAVRVQDIVAGSAAALSGLKRGDWIVGIDGDAIADLSDLSRRLAGDDAARTVTVRLLRPSSGVLKPIHALLTPRLQ